MTYEALLNDEDEDEFEFTSLGFESARTRAGFAGDQKNESFVAEEGDGDDGEDGEDDEDEDDE